MGLLSLFKNTTSTPGAAATTPADEPQGLWRQAPFAAFAAGEEVHSIYVRDRVPALVPSFVVDFALGCTAFRSLPVHIAQYAEKHAWGSLEIEALRSWLPKLTEAGMLLSREQLHARASAIGDPHAEPAKISAIGFSTGGDRGARLLRSFRSFVENVRTHGRTVDFLVADSSTEPAQRGRLRGQAGELGGDLGVTVRYLGEQEKRRFAAELLRRSGCRPEALEFGLFDPLGTGFARGANRNALLLHEAGAMLSSVDDDVLCEFASAPPADARLALFSNGDPYERWVFADRGSALEAVNFEPRDYLAEHEKLLGRDLGALLTGMGAAEGDVSNVGLGLLRRLEAGTARVRTTFMGCVGDPELPASCFDYFHKGRNRERLTKSAEESPASLASRSVLARPRVPSLGDDSVAPGMAIGLDHRELLPPFFPVLPAESMVFSTATWKCCAGSISGHLPLSVHHDSGDLNPEDRAAVFEFAQMVQAILSRHQSGELFDSAIRLQKLGRHLTEFAAQSAADFREAFHHIVLEHESRKIMALEESLRTETDAPEFWRRDLQDFLDHTREAMQQEDFDIPYALKAGRTSDENRGLMQQLIGSYGLLLEDWPGIVSAARDLRREGTCFSVGASGA
ncbi:MAG: hypothetical protein ABJF10_00220 [Chthoniobacter sp.]|uniref:hypothetical protein n=1 Tax=Chthoniobacter sp. TaxID=2510640 RepID=UPI0032A5AF5B